MNPTKPARNTPFSKPIDRRTLLRGAGGVALALPFLEAMAPRKARAGVVAPHRFLTVFAENGIVPSTWFPTGAGKAFTLPMSTSPLEPWKSNLIFFDGVDTVCDGTNGGGGHMRGKTGCLTAQPNLNGRAFGISIDQLIANKIGMATRFRSIEASVYLKGALRDGLFFSGPSQVVVPEDDPGQLFARLFSDPLPTPAGMAADPAAAAAFARVRAKKQSVFDHALAEYRRISGVVGAQDRQRLDNHVEAIRSVERGLTAGSSGTEASASCKKPAAPTSGSYIADTKAQMDLLSLALACDLTRVASLQWRSAITSFPWVNVSASHHGLSHQTGSPGPDAQLSRIVQWHVGQFAEMLGRLKGIADVDGSTLLDNTLVYYTNEISIGSHKHDRAPLVMATGNFTQPNGKKLETQRVLKYSGAAHSGLLTVLGNLMGLDITNFGATQWQHGPLPGVMA
jgi:hypothetical protein